MLLLNEKILQHQCLRVSDLLTVLSRRTTNVKAKEKIVRDSVFITNGEPLENLAITLFQAANKIHTRMLFYISRSQLMLPVIFHFFLLSVSFYIALRAKRVRVKHYI